MPFTYNRTVRFSDTDAAGVVYFANVLSICHEAYEVSLEVSSINMKYFFSSTVAFPIVHADVDFFRPMFCGDKLVISLIPQKLGVDKFEIVYEIIVDDVMVAKAVTRHVCIEVSSRNKTELSGDIVKWLETNRTEAESAERRRSRETM